MSVAEETYELLEPETAAAYIDSRPSCRRWSTPARSTCSEIGDGNLNLVFVCQDAAGRGVVLKQALPYVRLVGPEWPFTPRRAVAEARAYARARPLRAGADPGAATASTPSATSSPSRTSPTTASGAPR